MKLQGLGIIFIIIVFPLILVLSYYVQLQVDTIALQTTYDNKLLNATHDALAAFEINTANEDLSGVSDSLRSIVNASTATFTNTLGTNLGLSNASKQRIQEYVPAMLYTLYDGYYIYAPTEVFEIGEKTGDERDDGVVISEGAIIVGEGVKDEHDPNIIRYYQIDGELRAGFPGNQHYGSFVYRRNDGSYSPIIDDETVRNTDYVLKSYMPYSATYVNGNNSATINYTLDNFMSISAKIGDIYYTKSGYYIQNIVEGWAGSSWESMGQDEIEKYCMSGQNDITITLNGITNPIEYHIEYKLDEHGNRIPDGAGDYIKYSVEELEVIVKNLKDNISDAADLTNYQDKKANLDNIKAITYYLTNTAFSNWVNDNLGFVKGVNMQENYRNDFDEMDPNNNFFAEQDIEVYHDFSLDPDNSIFTHGSNPEDNESLFNQHKYNIIKNSIQYNLNLAISAYSEKYQLLEFRMPLLTDNEWERITTKVSVVSFLQGLDCGLKNYNGYAVVSSTNNELSVIPEEIYYVEKDNFNNEGAYYHRIDCGHIAGTEFISFNSKEVKYDKIYEGDDTGIYKYDHKNLACYNCIVQSNYENNNTDITGDGKNDTEISLQDFIDHLPASKNNLKRAYYIAVGKERQNLYKTTAYSKNEGIEIDNSGTTSVNITGDIIKAEVTIRITNSDGVIGEIVSGSGKYVSTATRSTQTVVLENTGTHTINTTFPGSTATLVVESIKYIYK